MMTLCINIWGETGLKKASEDQKFPSGKKIDSVRDWNWSCHVEPVALFAAYLSSAFHSELQPATLSDVRQTNYASREPIVS